MALHVVPVGFEFVESLRSLVPRIKRRDKSLAEQLTRAASSVVLNIAEAEYSDPGTQRARLHTAAGSANETLAALRLAVAWGYLRDADIAGAKALNGRVLAMLWRLNHR